MQCEEITIKKQQKKDYCQASNQNLKSFLNLEMNSPKENTQRRMLNNRATVNSPKFAKFAARSPMNKSDSKKGESKTSLGSSQYLKDISRSKSKQDLSQSIPQRITQNIEHGEIQFQNGDRYEGGMKDGKMYGKGNYYFQQENLKYIGQFYDNFFHGWGAIKKNYGSQSPIYEGNFQYGKKHGEGKYEYGPNHFYNGNWAFDQKNGKGIYQYPEGLYNGQWEANKKHGQGTLRLNEGIEFKGQFQEDQFVNGLIRYPNGDQYSGGFYNNQRNGEGSYFSIETEERYKGQWKNDKKNGRGTVFMQNGDQLQCTFIDGKIDETQSCTYKWNSGEEQGSVFIGWFKNGRPQKGHVTRGNGQQFDTY